MIHRAARATARYFTWEAAVGNLIAKLENQARQGALLGEPDPLEEHFAPSKLPAAELDRTAFAAEQLPMTAGGEQQPSADHMVQFLQYLEEILAPLMSMPPELTGHLRRLLADRRHLKDPSILAFEPPMLDRMVNILYGDPKPTIGELSRALSRPLSTVSRIISTLEEYGYVQRLPDSEDGRVVRVALTDVGQHLYEVMQSHKTRSAQIILDCLTVEERIILLTLLGKVAAKLNREA